MIYPIVLKIHILFCFGSGNKYWHSPAYFTTPTHIAICTILKYRCIGSSGAIHKGIVQDTLIVTLTKCCRVQQRWLWLNIASDSLPKMQLFSFSSYETNFNGETVE